MDNEVAVMGVGLTDFRRLSGRSIQDLCWEAGSMALKDAGMDFRDIQIGFASQATLGQGLASDIFGSLGYTGIPLTRVESACASFSRGLFLAAQLVAAGAYETAMVIGIEKLPRGMLDVQMYPEDVPYEGRMGLFTPPASYAERGVRHMALYGTTREQIARIALKEHRNASLNPRACYRDVYTLEEILNARLISDPVTLYMCSAPCDGAAATIICSKKKARQYMAKPVRMVAWAGGSPIYSKEKYMDEIGEIELIGKKAYEMAGIGPKDVDVVQLHNAFSVAELFHLEELGLCPEGEAGPFIWEGNTDIDGKIPVNTDGGLVGRAHPIGATGGAMIAELVWQLRGQAGARQVKNPKVALAENDGGGGSNVFILKI